MNCESAQDLIAARWTSGLEEDARIALDKHLADCPACRREAEELTELWHGLDDLPAADPSPAVRARFERTLQAYRLGAESRRRWAFSSMTPSMQWMAAAAALAIGVFVGHLYTERGHDQERITTLSAEVHQMRQLVAVSLLRQSSASERLRGVGYSVQAAGGEVTEALFDALDTDSNVNVRLAAIEALRQVASRADATRHLQRAALSQESPLVQMALIDWAVEAKDRASLKALESRAELDPTVASSVANALIRIQ